MPFHETLARKRGDVGSQSGDYYFFLRGLLEKRRERLPCLGSRVFGVFRPVGKRWGFAWRSGSYIVLEGGVHVQPRGRWLVCDTATSPQMRTLQVTPKLIKMVALIGYRGLALSGLNRRELAVLPADTNTDALVWPAGRCTLPR